MESNYTYNTQHECLQEVMLISSGNTVIQNKYKYNLDLVDSILGITNTANPKNIAEKNKVKFGGAYSHSYTYDGINRLVSASSKAKTASYWLDMTYGIMGEPLTKKQKVDSSKVAQSYAFAYLYEDSKHPTVPSQIGHNHYTYDAGGNPLTIMNDSTNTTREMYWDEDNRLMVLSDNGKTSRYTYNAAGERIMKSYGTMEGVYINGAPQGITFHETDNFTLYPASILSVNKNRFTKHYFIGDKRVASRIGMGLFNNVYGRNGSYVTAGQQDYAERMNQIQTQKEAYYKKVGVAPGVPTEKGAYGEPENTGVGYNAVLTELGNHDVPQGWIQTPHPNTTPGTNPGAPVSWNDPSNPDDPQAGYGYIPNDTTKEETFFYHSDHLGSTSYITDDKANITQYGAYLPYGELLVDEHSSSEELPYKFNGKQFDEETGLYYYGARYMNPVTSLWYGVDPEIEKVPGCSPFTYTFSNPITLIDPNGQSAKVTVNTHSKTIVVSATLVFYGECASAAIATQTAADIQNGWNEAHGTVKLGNTTYNVIFKIKGEYRDVSGWLGLKRAELKLEMAKNTDPEINYIEVVKYATKGSIPGISNFDIGGNRGEFQYNNIQGSGTTTEAHEFGHGLGLKHPDRDLRKKGQPGIMAPRNTLVDPKYQYNPKAKPASRNGGTLNPAKRKVTQEDIDNLKINKLHFKDGKAYLGHAT